MDAPEDKTLDEIADEAADTLRAALENLGSGVDPAGTKTPAEPAADAAPPVPDPAPAESGDGGDDDDDEGDETPDAETLLQQLREKDAEIERLKAAPSAAAAPAADTKADAPAKDPDPEPEVKGETYDEMMDRISRATDPSALNDEDRQVFNRLNALKTQQRTFEDLRGQLKGAEEKEAKLNSERKDLELLLKRAEAELAEDDLDPGNQRRVERYRTELREKRDEIRDHQVGLTRLETKAEREKARLDGEIVRLNDEAQAFHREVQTVQTRDSRAKSLQTVWNKGLADVFSAANNTLAARKERQFDADEQAAITEHFSSLLNAHIREHKAAPEDLGRWIAEQKAPFERVTRIRQKASGSVAKRVADLEPRRPSDAKAGRSTPRGKERERSFEDEYEASGEKLERLLRAG